MKITIPKNFIIYTAGKLLTKSKKNTPPINTKVLMGGALNTSTIIPLTEFCHQGTAAADITLMVNTV